VLRRADLADDARFRSNSLRVEHRLALHDAIDGVLGTLSTTEIIERLECARIAFARMNSVAEFVRHPQLSARDCWREIDSPAGPLRALVPPMRMEDVEPVMGAVPSLGQHSDAIIEELGFDRSTIARWRKEGTI